MFVVSLWALKATIKKVNKRHKQTFYKVIVMAVIKDVYPY